MTHAQETTDLLLTNGRLCKIMLQLIPIRPKAQELLAEEQAAFITGWSTAEQTFSSQAIIKKRLEHQRDLFHNFIDFKKAFDRVWHAGLWQVLRNFNIEEGLIQVIQTVCVNSSSAVLLNSQLGESFKTTEGVCQGCLLSPFLFNFS